MESVSQLDLAPLRGLMNMIKENYFEKPEVFHMIITLLDDYSVYQGSNRRKKISRYLKILLVENLDLADCLISLLPDDPCIPTSSATHDPVRTTSDALSPLQQLARVVNACDGRGDKEQHLMHSASNESSNRTTSVPNLHANPSILVQQAAGKCHMISVHAAKICATTAGINIMGSEPTMSLPVTNGNIQMTNIQLLAGSNNTSAVNIMNAQATPNVKPSTAFYPITCLSPVEQICQQSTGTGIRRSTVQTVTELLKRRRAWSTPKSSDADIQREFAANIKCNATTTTDSEQLYVPPMSSLTKPGYVMGQNVLQGSSIPNAPTSRPYADDRQIRNLAAFPYAQQMVFADGQKQNIFMAGSAINIDEHMKATNDCVSTHVLSPVCCFPQDPAKTRPNIKASNKIVMIRTRKSERSTSEDDAESCLTSIKISNEPPLNRVKRRRKSPVTQLVMTEEDDAVFMSNSSNSSSESENDENAFYDDLLPKEVKKGMKGTHEKWTKSSYFSRLVSTPPRPDYQNTWRLKEGESLDQSTKRKRHNSR